MTGTITPLKSPKPKRIKLGKAIAGIGLSACLSAATFAQDISQYAWDYRPVFVFSGHNADTVMKNQLNAFSDQKAQLDDRNMALISVIGESVTVHHGPTLNTSAKVLRERYNVQNNQFTLILAGKDTGVKLRRSKYLPKLGRKLGRKIRPFYKTKGKHGYNMKKPKLVAETKGFEPSIRF